MIAKVIVDIATSELDKIFDYKIGYSGAVRGSRVIVPFGRFKTEGFVIETSEISEFPDDKLKSIIRVIDEVPALTEENLALAEYIHKKYHSSMASVLRLFLPSEMRTGKVRKKTANYVSLAEDIAVESMLSSIRKGADKQVAVIKYLQKNGKTKASILNETFSASSVTALKNKGYLVVTEEQILRTPYKNLDNQGGRVLLTNEQKSAVESVILSDKPTLIKGVTGSGKTEVYLQLIEKTILSGKTAIMLVPEISLTPQTFSRLRSRFGDKCAILHSGLSAGEKFDEWWRLRSNEATIAIGARSAIFAPLENLGIIIIDEEHDQSYESETSPRYVTEEIALMRAKLSGAKLVLGSATPKVESYLKAKNGEYNLAVMNERVNGKPLPEIVIADMREEVKRGNISPFSLALKAELQKTLESGNQAIIFLNRRGYSQKVICRECGYVAKCLNCDVSLNYHKADDVLKCHYCGSQYHMLTACPECGSVSINYSGTGTQKVVTELNELFPNAKILRMDNDTTQNKEGHFKILKEFGEKKADILVGTQMVAKGHDFPSVTLVGILDADMSLYFSDYRSGERTFQLVTQVAGRSGRAGAQGKVVLQTYSPKNPTLTASVNYDYESFYNREVAVRKASYFPPFSHVVRIMVESEDESLAISTLKQAFEKAKQVQENYHSSFIYFDRMKSPVKRIKNKFRYQILCRIKDDYARIEDEFYSIANGLTSKKVLCYVEVNPSTMN
ncbi:MAG: primosomal protein N' [Clostridiales bacterium]|nr:primosomal protein N' [Clostridiales bacterium]